MTSSFAFQASAQIRTRNRIGPVLFDHPGTRFQKSEFSGTGSVWTVGPNAQDLCGFTKQSALCGQGLKWPLSYQNVGCQLGVCVCVCACACACVCVCVCVPVRVWGRPSLQTGPCWSGDAHRDPQRKLRSGAQRGGRPGHPAGKSWLTLGNTGEG